jgi:hypothetical protein
MIKTTLNLDKVAAQTSIGPEWLIDAKLEDLSDIVNETLIRRLRGYVLCGPVRSIDIPLPDGWFQHVKQDLFPSWLLRKYPVRYKSITIDVKEVFPDLSHLVKDSKQRNLSIVSSSKISDLKSYQN